MSTPERRPDFIVGGVQRGGTTWLYELLSRQPRFRLPARKEIAFFSHHFERGIEWYERQFDGLGKTQGLALGEVSPQYFHRPEVADRIASVLPSVKMIFLLRNPVERAVSNYWFNVARGAQNPQLGLKDVFETQRGKQRYLWKGRYCCHLQRYIDCIGIEHILLLISEEAWAAPEDCVKRIATFVMGEEIKPRDTEVGKANQSHIVEGRLSKCLLSLIVKAEQMTEVERLPAWLQSIGKGLRRRLSSAGSSADRGDGLSRQLRRKLEAYFESDVEFVERVLGRPGELWWHGR